MTNESPNPYNVQIGQVWQSCDKRYPGVNLQVVRVYEDRGYALCLVIKTGKFRRVQLKRFRDRSNGYRMVDLSKPDRLQ